MSLAINVHEDSNLFRSEAMVEQRKRRLSFSWGRRSSGKASPLKLTTSDEQPMKPVRRLSKLFSRKKKNSKRQFWNNSSRSICESSVSEETDDDVTVQVQNLTTTTTSHHSDCSHEEDPTSQQEALCIPEEAYACILPPDSDMEAKKSQTFSGQVQVQQVRSYPSSPNAKGEQPNDIYAILSNSCSDEQDIVVVDATQTKVVSKSTEYEQGYQEALALSASMPVPGAIAVGGPADYSVPPNYFALHQQHHRDNSSRSEDDVIPVARVVEDGPCSMSMSEVESMRRQLEEKNSRLEQLERELAELKRSMGNAPIAEPVTPSEVQLQRRSTTGAEQPTQGRGHFLLRRRTSCNF